MDTCAVVLEFEADFRNVDLAREALQGIAAACFGPDSPKADEVAIAATEAMNNAVEHSGSPVVRLEIQRVDSELRLAVISDGPRFDPTAAVAGLNQESMLQRDEGGYGLYLINTLVDRFLYEFQHGRNIWKLIKFR